MDRSFARPKGRWLQRALRFPDPLADDAFGSWLAGLVDGEGSFQIREQEGKHRPALQLKFRDDDLPTLILIQQRLGFGDINGPYGPYRKHRSWGQDDYRSRPQAYWYAQNRADCRRVVDIFDRFPLQSKKRHEYPIWREAVLEDCSTQPDQNRLEQLKRDLEALRRHYNPLPVQALWGMLKRGELNSMPESLRSRRPK